MNNETYFKQEYLKNKKVPRKNWSDWYVNKFFQLVANTEAIVNISLATSSVNLNIDFKITSYHKDILTIGRSKTNANLPESYSCQRISDVDWLNILDDLTHEFYNIKWHYLNMPTL